MGDTAIEFVAEDAVLLRFGDHIDAAVNARVHAAATALRRANLPGILDIAPAYASLLVRFDPLAWTHPGQPQPCASLVERLRATLRGAPTEPLPSSRPDRKSSGPPAIPATIAIPVCYGGEYGCDLGAVAEHAGLSVSEVIQRHTGAEYSVAMLGFAPGFPYLLGLDARLHAPRRSNPRTRVPAGSIAIGGAQTGIYPRELPGGWNLIGRTPLTLFDPARDPPCLLAPGDRVRFRAIASEAFARLAGTTA